jgi:ADP-ribose pyrophosphatase
LEGRPDASPDEIARTELAEETGLRAGTLELIGELYAAYGFCSQSYFVFLATELTQGASSPEPEEQGLLTRTVSLPELEEMMGSGQMVDGHSVAAYGLLRASRWRS